MEKNALIQVRSVDNKIDGLAKVDLNSGAFRNFRSAGEMRLDFGPW